MKIFEDLDEWSEVVDAWDSSRETRLNMWSSRTSGLTTIDIYDNFVFLTGVQSDELIISDFENRYPSAITSYRNWKQENYKKVLNRARRFRDDYARMIINMIDMREGEGKFTKIYWALKSLMYSL